MEIINKTILPISLSMMLMLTPAIAQLQIERTAEVAFAKKIEATVNTTDTLEKMKTIDYFKESSTGITETAYTRKEIEKLVKDYGVFDGPMGMPVEEYSKAMEQEWEDATVYGRKARKVSVNVEKAYTYNDIVSIMRKLSRYTGVYLYRIGETVQGRTMYALEVDVPSDKEKNTVVLTGTVHARETAGTTFILKEIADLLSADTEESREVLATTRFACVPCVNPDGREGVCFDTKNYTYSDGQYWKATSNGTDLNRNFPGLSWSQIANGCTKCSTIGTSAKGLYYPGDYAGSCPETKALVKFLYHYIAIEKAQILMDYHQQGAVAYAGKPWSKEEQYKNSRALADRMFEVLNKGNKSKYYWIGEVSYYNLNGEGSTLTDFACSVAYGGKYSPGYGFYVFSENGKEYPLIMVPHMDESDLELKETTPGFRAMTFEIGAGRQYLGYTEKTRKLLAEEYVTRHFDRVLYEVSKYANEISK